MEKNYLSKQVAKRFLEAVNFLIASGSKEVEKQIGVSKRSLDLMGSGSTKSVTVEACCRLCKIYQISSYWLLLGQGEMTSVDKTVYANDCIHLNIQEVYKAVHGIEGALKDLRNNS